MTKQSPDYSKTILYKISCKNPNITDSYIGCTTNFKSRKYCHKSCVNGTRDLKLYNCIRANGGWDNWTIDKLEYFICENTIQAHKRERELIELHKPSLNICIPTRTINEWYKDNPTYVKEWCQENPNYFKEWRTDNYELYKETRRKYRIKNSDKLKEQYQKWCRENPNYFKEWRLKNPDYKPPCLLKKETKH